MFQNLQPSDIMALVFAFPVIVVGAVVVRKTCKSNYGFFLLVSMFILNATASRFGLLREMSKAYLRWPLLMILAVLAFLPVDRTATSGRHGAFRVGIFFFLVIAMMSVVYSPSRTYVFMRVVSFAILCVGVYVGVFQRAAWPERLRGFMDVFYKLAFAVVGVGVLVFVRPLGEGESRFSGFFYNPNGSGIFCAIFLPIVIWQYWERKGSRLRLMPLGLAIVMAAFVFLSGSRSAVITTFFASAFLLMTLYGSGALIPVGLISAVAVTGVIASGYFTADVLEGTRFDRSTGALGSTHRWDLWMDAVPYIKDRPILGTGFGYSRYIFDERIEREGLDPMAYHGRTLHSMHVQVLVDLGIVGVVFLEAFIIYLLVQGAQVFFKRDGTRERALAAALFASCLVVCMDSFVHGWLYSAGSQCALLFHVIAACTLQATSQWQLARQVESASEAPGEGVPLAVGEGAGGTDKAVGS